MCFAPGVVKQLGTYDDFEIMIKQIAGDLLDDWTAELRKLVNQLRDDAESYLQGKIDQTWIPALQAYVTQAQGYASQASTSASNAKTSENNAKSSATSASTSASQASTSASNASTSASQASSSATAARTSETNAENWAKLAESHSHGGTGVRTGEATDNSKYWSEQSRIWTDQIKSDGEELLDHIGQIGEEFVSQAKGYADELKGKHEFDWKDDYVPGTSYLKGNLVYYQGCVYICMKDGVTSTPTDDGTNWSLFTYGINPEATSIQEWELTLFKGSWTSDSYRITDSRISESDILDFYAIIDSDAAKKAYGKLDIRTITYENGSAVLSYAGEKPTIDLKAKLRTQRG